MYDNVVVVGIDVHVELHEYSKSVLQIS